MNMMSYQTSLRIRIRIHNLMGNHLNHTSLPVSVVCRLQLKDMSFKDVIIAINMYTHIHTTLQHIYQTKYNILLM